MARSWDYYNDIARIYDDMYDEPYWILYHLLTEKLIEDDLKMIGIDSLENIKVLDLGSGTGRWAIFFAEKRANVFSIDPSIEMLKIQKEKIEKRGFENHIKIFCAKAEKIPFESESFDIVNAQGDVLSYVEDIEESMKEIRRILKTGGLLISSVDSFYDFANSMITKGALVEFHSLERTRITEIGDLNLSSNTFTSRVFTVEDIESLMENNGFDLIDLAGKIVFGPYNADFLAKRMDEILEIECKYCRMRELIGRSEHIHFAAVKK